MEIGYPKHATWPCILLKDLTPLCDEFERLERERNRAIEIADEAMHELLTSHCVPLDRERDWFGLTDEYGGGVKRLADADPAIREAFDWLSSRDLAKLRRDERGEYIVVGAAGDAE